MKTKRALCSMLIFMTVFSLSIIFDINNVFKDSSNPQRETTDSIASQEMYKKHNKPTAILSYAYESDEISSFNSNNESKDKMNGVSSLAEQEKTILESRNGSDIASTKDYIPSEDDSSELQDPEPSEEISLPNKDSEEVDLTSQEDKSMNSQEPVEPDEGSEDEAENKEEIEEETEEEQGKYANIGISIAKSYVHVRKEPNTESESLGKLYKDSAAEIISLENGWYYLESGSVKGYAKADYIKTGIPDEELIKKYGVSRIRVNTDGLNVREEPSTEARKLTVIYMNEKYPVMELQEEWVKVDIQDDKVIGYVNREYVELIIDFNKAISKEEEKELLRLKEEERIKKETQIKYRDEVDYTKEELKLLACLVHAEAGNQSYEGKLAVANIVLNRVRSKKYPNTIKKVIYQAGQFTVAKSGSLQKQLDNYHNYDSNSQKLSIKAAKAALEGANNIGSRLYFHTYKAAVKKGYDKKPNSVKLEDHLFW
ncbi:MAG TPA: cell wall hydrolase [Clostridiales bacterium]|nr:cell wall hydrolase [Clostridiales bacterium]